MRKRIHICAVRELEPGARRVVEITFCEEALVLNLDGTICAVSNICAHQGASLERGYVEGNVLYCPLHRWGFDLCTGAYVEDASIGLPTYRVEKHRDDLFLCVT